MRTHYLYASKLRLTESTYKEERVAKTRDEAYVGGRILSVLDSDEVTSNTIRCIKCGELWSSLQSPGTCPKCSTWCYCIVTED